jgi:hypothetical protein
MMKLPKIITALERQTPLWKDPQPYVKKLARFGLLATWVTLPIKSVI